MQLSLMGATSYIVVVAGRLQTAGHKVVELARSSATAARLGERHIIPFIGDIFMLTAQHRDICWGKGFNDGQKTEYYDL